MRLLLLCLLLTAPVLTWAQQDSLVEVNGIVLAKDSLKPLPSVSIVIRGTGRGTISNERGAFGMVALLGQELEITSVGYKPQHFSVTPSDHAHVIILEADTTYMATALIRARVSKEQFQRDFLGSHFEDKNQETAKKGLDPSTLKILSKGVPLNSSEKADRTLTQNAKNYSTQGTVPDMIGVNLLTLFKGKKKRVKPLPPMGSDLDATPPMAGGHLPVSARPRADSAGLPRMDSASLHADSMAKQRADSAAAKLRSDSIAARLRADSAAPKSN